MLQCVPAHRLLEQTSVASVAEVQAQHAQRLKDNKHLRYMWLPHTDSVVVVTCNEVPQVGPPGAGNAGECRESKYVLTPTGCRAAARHGRTRCLAMLPNTAALPIMHHPSPCSPQAGPGASHPGPQVQRGRAAGPAAHAAIQQARGAACRGGPVSERHAAAGRPAGAGAPGLRVGEEGQCGRGAVLATLVRTVGCAAVQGCRLVKCDMQEPHYWRKQLQAVAQSC